MLPALQQRRLLSARDAPGGPEVEDDDLAAEGGKRESARPVEARQFKRWRLRPLAVRDGLVDRSVGLVLGDPVGQ